MRVPQGSWAWKDLVDLFGHQGFEGDTVTQWNDVYNLFYKRLKHGEVLNPCKQVSNFLCYKPLGAWRSTQFATAVIQSLRVTRNPPVTYGDSPLYTKGPFKVSI